MTVVEYLETLPDGLKVTLKPVGFDLILEDIVMGWRNGYSDDDLNAYFEVPGVTPDPNGPVDIEALMSGEPPEASWMVEPVLPKGKLVGFVSRRGEGKSLFTLDLAANRAAGAATLDQPADPPVHVIYLDLEMGPEDLFDRLLSLGWSTDHPAFKTLCEHLHYYQLVTMSPLDTAEGGEELEQLVERHGAELVVIDTVSRVISGEENAAEPFRDLFRHTETRLKRRGVTLARLDHLGKDTERGSRGSSAKEDPLDVVWHVNQATDDTLQLKLTKGRQDWVPRTVTVKRTYTNGVLAHEVPPDFAPEWLLTLVDRLDSLGVSVDTTGNDAYKALREAGDGARRNRVLQAVKFRQRRANVSETRQKVVPDFGEPPGTTPREPLGEPPGTTPQETTPDLGLFNGNHPGNHPEPDIGSVSPPRGGNHPVSKKEESSIDDLPDPW